MHDKAGLRELQQMTADKLSADVKSGLQSSSLNSAGVGLTLWISLPNCPYKWVYKYHPIPIFVYWSSIDKSSTPQPAAAALFSLLLKLLQWLSSYQFMEMQVGHFYSPKPGNSEITFGFSAAWSQSYWLVVATMTTSGFLWGHETTNSFCCTFSALESYYAQASRLHLDSVINVS